MSNLFDILRMGAPAEPAPPARFDAAAGLRAAAEFYAPAFREAALELTVEAPEPAMILAGEYDFSRMCGNLAENALRYAPRGGAVRLAAETDAGAVTVRVEDSGPPIPEAEAAMVFAPFYRGSGHAAGAGLGLYLVARLAKRYGGKAGFERRDGRNSFWLAFPPSPGITGSAPAGAVERPETDDAFGGSLVLAVSEDDDARGRFVDILRSRVRLRTVRSLEEALGLVRGGLRPDVMVIDVVGLGPLPPLPAPAVLLDGPVSPEMLWRRLAAAIGPVRVSHDG
jgi:hypothetical protein